MALTNTFTREEIWESIIREGIRARAEEYDCGSYYREPMGFAIEEDGLIFDIEAEISGSIDTEYSADPYTQPATEIDLYYTAEALVFKDDTLEEIHSFKLDGEINS